MLARALSTSSSVNRGLFHSMQHAKSRCYCQHSISESSTLAAIEEALGTMSTAPMVKPPKPVALVVSGPSGVGKDHLVAKLHQLRPDLQFVVTATTRAMREGEVDGVDYHFVSKSKFEEWIQQDELYEYATVYGEYKGIPKSSVLGPMQDGKDVVLRLDVQGAATVRQLMPRVVSVYVAAASEAELVQRLVRRKTETTEALIERVRTLKQECERISEFEYVIVNKAGASDAAAAQMAAIVDAGRCRVAS